MSLGATLGIVVAALRSAGVPFMIAGSIASTLHGEPRATQDVDIVVDPLTPEALDRFATSLEPARFYVGDHRAAFSVRGMFNIIDKTNGWKIDLILRRDRPFSVAEFERRQPATIEGVDVDIATAEDVVLSKLEWARHGESERQRSDARAVLAASSDSVDRSYLELWAEQLDLTDDLNRLLDGG